ncbi:hypothetical protein [Pararhodobacter zhoushanensis]|uniref:Bacteriophage Rz lysis protein n=1 Tax=Pararhodobacter zhoushanensis TaxID=2479545 RepID=A0ABT3GYI4_9RHOB|nr:hypothetical protein [Pararhodobacter zhoushanensis]MCW1932596.1 hypothetical protein [Pararhodobacter zhoushanensis]
MIRALAALPPWAIGLVFLLASWGGAVGYGYHWRGNVERDRVARAQADLREAQARIIGLAEAQAAAALERDRLQQELDDAAANDPDADRMCLGADSVRRLGSF